MIPRKHLLLGLKLLISCGLFLLLYQKTPLNEIHAVFAQCNLFLLAVIFVLLLANTSLSALKWRILLLSDGIDIPLRKLVVSYLIGGFFNIFLPSNIGGDAYRIYDVMHRSKEGVRSAASVFADRLSGFIALVTLSLVSSVFVAFRLDRPPLILLPMIILLALLTIIFLLWRQTPIRWMLHATSLDRMGPVAAICEKLLETFGRYAAESRTIVRVMLISFLFQSLLVVAVYLMALSLHTTVPWMYFGAFVPLITLMEAIPVSVYGIGIRDVGYVYFFGMAGMGEVQTRSLALLFLAITVGYSLVGGGLYLSRVYMAWRQAGAGPH